MSFFVASVYLQFFAASMCHSPLKLGDDGFLYCELLQRLFASFFLLRGGSAESISLVGSCCERLCW